MPALPTVRSSPPRVSRTGRSAASKRTQSFVLVGPGKVGLCCGGKSPTYDRRRRSAASGGRGAGTTPGPAALRLLARLADGPNSPLPLGGVRLPRSPAALAQPLCKDGCLHHRALLPALCGTGLLHGPAQHL